MEFILASNNSGKAREFNRILGELGHKVITLREMGISADIEETGKTFRENSYIKAKAIFDLTGKPTIADDSGLMTDYLNGEPGVYSARFGGDLCKTDKDRTELLLQKLRNVPKEQRGAQFVCSVCAILDKDRILETEGICRGEITTEICGNNGFGYDPVFYVEEYKKTFGELSDIEKNSISHRGKALSQFVELLKNI